MQDINFQKYNLLFNEFDNFCETDLHYESGEHIFRQQNCERKNQKTFDRSVWKKCKIINLSILIDLPKLISRKKSKL